MQKKSNKTTAHLFINSVNIILMLVYFKIEFKIYTKHEHSVQFNFVAKLRWNQKRKHINSWINNIYLYYATTHNNWLIDMAATTITPSCRWLIGFTKLSICVLVHMTMLVFKYMLTISIVKRSEIDSYSRSVVHTHSMKILGFPRQTWSWPNMDLWLLSANKSYPRRP